jgi:acetolactate synthase-1/2/3 large subunit
MSEQETRSGADVILELLRTHGIDCIFASPIAVMAPLWEALARRRERGEPDTPRYLRCPPREPGREPGGRVLQSHRTATGRVFLPSGLGVLHGAMALRTALQERIPMTVLSPDSLTYGDVPELDPGPEWPSLLIDFHGPARDAEPCVKWAKEAKTAGDLVHELRRALHFANAVPRGPTLLTVPFDLMLGAVPLEPRPRIEARPVIAAAEQLDEIAALLLGAEEPVVITEHGGRSAAERAALIGLAEALTAPIFETMMPAYHNAPRTHPLVMLGPVEPVLERADVILIAGANAPWHPPQHPLRAHCRVIHLEEDPLRPRSAYWGYRTTDAIAGDRLGNLEALVQRVRAGRVSPAARAQRWHEYKQRTLERGRHEADTALAQAKTAVPAAELFRALHRLLPESSVVVDEIIAQMPHMMQFLFESKPFQQYRGWAGALGTSLGTALGAKLAQPAATGGLHPRRRRAALQPVHAAFGFAQGIRRTDPRRRLRQSRLRLADLERAQVLPRRRRSAQWTADRRRHRPDARLRQAGRSIRRQRRTRHRRCRTRRHHRARPRYARCWSLRAARRVRRAVIRSPPEALPKKPEKPCHGLHGFTDYAEIRSSSAQIGCAPRGNPCNPSNPCNPW